MPFLMLSRVFLSKPVSAFSPQLRHSSTFSRRAPGVFYIRLQPAPRAPPLFTRLQCPWPTPFPSSHSPPSFSFCAQRLSSVSTMLPLLSYNVRAFSAARSLPFPAAPSVLPLLTLVLNWKTPPVHTTPRSGVVRRTY